MLVMFGMLQLVQEGHGSFYVQPIDSDIIVFEWLVFNVAVDRKGMGHIHVVFVAGSA